MSNQTSNFSRITRKKISDHRGWFLKVIDGTEPGNPFPCEVYFTAAKPGESKGGHYHPKANEWFSLVMGEATLNLINTATGERASVVLNSDEPCTIFVPAGVAHQFVNTGSGDFLVVAYTDRPYEAEDTVSWSF